MPDLDIVARLKLAGEAFSSEFDGRMKRVEDSARSMSARVNTAIGGVNNGLKALAAGIGVAAIADLAKRGLEYASSLGEVSQQLGVTTRDLQVYRFAGTQVGIEQEVMDKGLAKLTVTLGKAATGAAAPRRAFEALGIDVRDANGHVRTAGETIPLIADALSRVTDPAQRAAIEVALFGKAGQQLDTLLAGGRAQIDELAKSAEKLGIVLSDEQIQRADDTADKLAKMKRVLEANIAGVVADNATAIYRLADALGRLASTELRGVQRVMNFFDVRQTRGPDAAAAYRNLAQTHEGRAAAISDLNARLEQNSADRAKGRGDRTSHLGGLFETTRNATDADLAGLDADFRRLTRVRNALIAIERQGGPARAAAPKPLAGEDVADFLATPKVAKHAAANRDAAAAAREAEAAERQMADLLNGLVDKYDPVNAEAAKYAATLRDIADLTSAGKIGVGQSASLSFAAGQEHLETVKRTANEQADRAFKSIGIDPRADLTAMVDQASGRWHEDMVAGAEAAGLRFGETAGSSIRDIAETLQAAFGLKIGGGASRAISILGAGPAAANDNFGKGVQEAFTPIKDVFTSKMDKLFGKGGSFEKSLGELSGNAALGGAGGGIFTAIGGGKENKLASSLGGALGGFAGKELGKTFGKTLGSLSGLAGPLGSIAGGIAGNVISGLFKKATPQASTTLTFGDGQLGVGAATGSGSQAKAAATALGGSLVDSLNSIADALGGTVSGAGSVSIGYRPGHKAGAYRVDTSGSGKLTGVLAFETEEEAVKAALADALSDGVISGISEASQRILRSGQDVSKAITKASLIEQVPKDLKAMLDPVGAAVDELNAKFKKTVDALKEGGATTDQMTQAERLYRLQLDQVKASTSSASQSLKDFTSSLKLGSDSPYSLRDQEATAKDALSPYLSAINAGGAIDQDKYQAAAKTFLDIERQLYGSTQDYFKALDDIQAATNRAISTIDNAVPISTPVADPFAVKTADASATTASNTAVGNELLSQISDTLAATQAILAQIAAGGDDVSDFIGQTRAFAA